MPTVQREIRYLTSEELSQLRRHAEARAQRRPPNPGRSNANNCPLETPTAREYPVARVAADPIVVSSA